jgi:hypothetical protein
MNGMFNEMTCFNDVAETVQDVLKHYDESGRRKDLRSLYRGMGCGGRYAIYLDEADCLKPWRKPQRDGHSPAKGFQGERRVRSVAPAGSEASVMIRRGSDPGFSSRIQRFAVALSFQRFVHRSKSDGTAVPDESSVRVPRCKWYITDGNSLSVFVNHLC